MINTLSTTPKMLGQVKIPFDVRGTDLFSKKIAMKLPDVQQGWCCAVEFANGDELRIGRKQILTACMRMYGSGRVQTASRVNVLYVWLKPQELKIAAQVKAHLFGSVTEVQNDQQ
ncbi:MAG: hypothetical protein CVU43_04650 [Chloroflexi bacterium HGW-Chloroflexi-5]|nr:MAG: hypothetical protein CVU43_04650 [Chloroflexi bacterium HGW-Chloroflexi-5]